MLTLTPFAVQKAKEIRAEQKDSPGEALRIFVQPGGCSGFEYGFTLDAPRDGDEVVALDGIDVIVDPSSQIYLQGAEVDYVETALEASFVVKANPNEQSRCGCGTSFSV